MSENFYLSNALYAADDKAEYDAGAKKILADKQVSPNIYMEDFRGK